MNLKKNLDISLCFLLFSVIFVGSVSAQQRARVVPNQTNQTQNRESRPLHQNPNPTEIVKKTVFSSPLSAPVIARH
jgi:hypothetical protein